MSKKKDAFDEARDEIHKRLNIKKAIKKPGQLHRDLNVPQGQTIPMSMMEKATKQKGKVGQRARFAMMLRGFNKR